MSQSDWGNFFVAQCGAAAALIGLLFVALSVNLQRILAAAFLVDRVLEAIFVFAMLLAFSVFGMVPHQSVFAFGVETLGVGMLFWLMTTRLQINGLREHPPQATRNYLIARIVIMQAATLCAVIAGALMMAGHDTGFYWLVPATLISYVAGIGNAWVLTVEILR